MYQLGGFLTFQLVINLGDRVRSRAGRHLNLALLAVTGVGGITTSYEVIRDGAAR